MSHTPRSLRRIRKAPDNRLRTLALAVVVLLLAAAPASASMVKTRITEHDGQTVVVSNTVGNQALPAQWVEHDEQRHADDGLTLHYRIDQTELPDGISWPETEAAIESAVATFNDVQCGKNFELVRVDTAPDANLGHMQNLVGLGGDPEPVADITFAGWVSNEFFDAVDPGAMGTTVPAARDTADDTVVYGAGLLNSDRTLSDIDGDGNIDLFAMEMYFNDGSNYVVNDDDLGNTLFHIDLESIVLHELGHALGMDHFGRAEVILDENGDFVDLIINRNSVNVMNTANYFVKRDLSGSDNGSFCGIYGSWGKGHASAP